MRRMLELKNPTLMDVVMLGGSARVITNQLIPAAEKLGRLTEHEIMSQLGSLVTWALLLVALAAVVIYRLRAPALIRRLAARMESLLQASDWTWLLIAGVVLPFYYFILITRLTPLGGRDFSLTENDQKFFPDTVIPLPLAQFLGLAILLILAPILVTRWRLGIRGAAFGFTNGKSWLGFATVVSAAAFIPVSGSCKSAIAGASRLTPHASHRSGAKRTDNRPERDSPSTSSPRWDSHASRISSSSHKLEHSGADPPARESERQAHSPAP